MRLRQLMTIECVKYYKSTEITRKAEKRAINFSLTHLEEKLAEELPFFNLVSHSAAYVTEKRFYVSWSDWENERFAFCFNSCS